MNQHLRLVDWSKQARPAIWLALLLLAAALTEGIGLLILVPMLSALGAGGEGGGRLAQLMEAIGLPLSLGPLLALFVALVTLRSLINHASALAGHRFECLVVDGLRARAWSALLHCEWRVLASMRQSDNASLLISNIDRIGLGLNQAIGGFASAATLCALGLAAFAISPVVSLASLAGGGLVLLAYRSMRRRAGQLGESMGEAFKRVHGELGEGLGALRVIKSFGQEAAMAERGAGGFASLRAAERAYLASFGMGQMALQGGGALLLALVIWLATSRWQAGPDMLLPIVVLAARAMPLLGQVQEAWQNFAHTRPAMDEALALIAQAEAAREPGANAAEAPRLRNAISLERVSVHYTGRDAAALCEVDLAIPARGVTLLAGPSGAGKSTLADLAGGLLAPDAGRLAIDSVALEGGLRRAWRSRVTYVQQEPVLFAGTVRSNLAWGAPEGTSQQAMEAALDAASATFVAALPQGLDSQVGDGGRHLSGGERQRIVLARALLRQSDLLILDEATSALDPANDQAIADAAKRLSAQMTVLVIGHRGAFSLVADRVISLDEGRVVSIEEKAASSD